MAFMSSGRIGGAMYDNSRHGFYKIGCHRGTGASMSDAGTRFSAALEAYEAMISTRPDIDRKGKKIPYTSMNGNMFSFLDGDGTICLRLSKDDQEKFIEAFNTPPVEQYGKRMREYVSVPDTMLSDTGSLASWFERSVAYARALKPKPTKR